MTEPDHPTPAHPTANADTTPAHTVTGADTGSGATDHPGSRSAKFTARALLAHETLACGASVDDILEQVADGHTATLSAHQQHCPHCQAAIAEFTSLWEPVATAAQTPLPTPSELATAVMARVRRLVLDVWYTLELTDGGSVQIAARVVATLARDAARRVPGVRVAFGRSSHTTLAQLVERATLGHRHPHAAVGVLGRTAVIDLAITATYGDVLDDIARNVQKSVITELRTNVGLQTITVNVTIDDISV
jgi:uncharacterized alkaline shock family protein YloU